MHRRGLLSCLFASVALQGCAARASSTPPAGSAPDSFKFASVTNAALSSRYTSNSITISGAATPVAITIVGGTYSKNGAAATALAGTVVNGDTVTVSLMSGAANNVAVTATLTIGGLVTSFTVTTPAPGTVYLRGTEKAWLDLTAAVAGIHDTNDITIALAGVTGQIAANVWLGKRLLPAQSSLQVKRELLDNFIIESIGATDGATIGALTVSGFAGAANTGAPVSTTVTFVCNNAALASWDFGVLTPAGYGGYPVHTFLGFSGDWTITAQSNDGQFAILSDDSRSLARLVLAGAYGSATRAVPPTAGTSASVTLRSASRGVSKTIAINFIARQYDCAPWPATDKTSGLATTQFAHSTRPTSISSWAYGNVYVLEDGVHDHDGYLVGFGEDFGAHPISNGIGAPTGPFAGDSWAMTPNPTYNPKLITIRSRTPLGADLKSITIDLKSIPRTTNRTVGLRLTNVQIDNFAIGDSSNANNACDLVVVDHCYVSGAGVNAGIAMGSGAPADTVGMIVIANDCHGSIACFGPAAKLWGNRISSSSKNHDSVEWCGTDGPAGTIAAGVTAENCFNLFIDKQGQDDPNHADYNQLLGAVTMYNRKTGPVSTGWVYGNIIWGGQHRTSTGSRSGVAGETGKSVIGGQGWFFHDGLDNVDYFQQLRFGGNAMVDISPCGLQARNPAEGSVIAYNMMLYDHAVTNPIFGAGTPTIQIDKGGSSYTQDTKKIQIKNNICEAYNIAKDDGMTPTETGNTFRCDGAWQTSHLNAAAIGPAAKDVGDIVRALSAKPGVTIANGPFCDTTMIDHRRQTVDLARLFA